MILIGKRNRERPRFAGHRAPGLRKCKSLIKLAGMLGPVGLCIDARRAHRVRPLASTQLQDRPMKQPLQIQFLGMETSPAVEALAREKALKLDRYCPDIMSCRMVIEHLNKHQHQGRQFAVRIHVTVPDHELAVDRVVSEDVYVALRDAYQDMRRQLEDTTQRRRGFEKTHPTPVRGEVVRFDGAGQAGFIRTGDGDEYYFDASNVVGQPFEHLSVGATVQFIPEVGQQGRQAKRVSTGKHGGPGEMPAASDDS
jgi:ribosomal subunit interface protein